MSDAEKLSNQMGGYRPETAHLRVPGFPGWDWLPFIRKGWKWDLEVYGRAQNVFNVRAGSTNTPITLRPGETYTFPTREPNQPQWLTGIFMTATSPYVKLGFDLDEFSFAASHYDLESLGGYHRAKANWVIESLKPKLISPIGQPLYTVILDPVSPVSVTSIMSVYANLPAMSPVAASEVLVFGLARVAVSDYNVFLDEVRKTSIELEVGQNIKQWADAQSKDGKLIADIGPSGRRTL